MLGYLHQSSKVSPPKQRQPLSLEQSIIFYNFWQKELRDLNAGIYNIMRSTSSAHMTATALLTHVNSKDKELESNLNTMFETMRGTKQYWYFRRSKLNCMIREYGSPTFFLTFSCAKYSSIDIAQYLRTVNNVAPSYNIESCALKTRCLFLDSFL